MARRKNISSDDKSASLKKRVYSLLPYFLFAVVAFNLWFVFSYVRRERISIDGVQDRVMLSVSNVLSFVHCSLSNDISVARQAFSNEVSMFRARTLALSTPLFHSVSEPSPVSTNSASESKNVYPSRVPVGDVPGYYFICSGNPSLCIDGSYYQVGDDFGYGSIDRITKLFVVCEGRYYRIVGSASRSLPSPVVPKQSTSEVSPNG